MSTSLWFEVGQLENSALRNLAKVDPETQLASVVDRVHCKRSLAP